MSEGESLPKHPAAILSSPRARGILVGGAVLLAGFLIFQYRHVEHLNGYPSRRVVYSAAEADGRISAATARLKDDPEDLDALTQLAIASYAKGPDSYVDAMNALEKARSLGATNTSLFFYAGVMYDALGLPDYAINELKKYLRHDPDDYETLVRLGNLYFHEEQSEEAYQVYKRAVDRWPKDPTVLFNYAVVCIKHGDLATAQSLLDKVKGMAGALPLGGIYEEGEMERIKGSTDTAIPLYQQEIQKNPEYLPALDALAAAYKEKKDWKSARELRQKISELKSNPHGEAQEK